MRERCSGLLGPRVRKRRLQVLDRQLEGTGDPQLLRQTMVFDDFGFELEILLVFVLLLRDGLGREVSSGAITVGVRCRELDFCGDVCRQWERIEAFEVGRADDCADNGFELETETVEEGLSESLALDVVHPAEDRFPGLDVCESACRAALLVVDGVSEHEAEDCFDGCGHGLFLRLRIVRGVERLEQGVGFVFEAPTQIIIFVLLSAPELVGLGRGRVAAGERRRVGCGALSSGRFFDATWSQGRHVSSRALWCFHITLCSVRTARGGCRPAVVRGSRWSQFGRTAVMGDNRRLESRRYRCAGFFGEVQPAGLFLTFALWCRTRNLVVFSQTLVTNPRRIERRLTRC